MLSEAPEVEGKTVPSGGLAPSCCPKTPAAARGLSGLHRWAGSHGLRF